MSTLEEELLSHFNNPNIAETIGRLDGNAVTFGETPNYIIIENYKNAKFIVEDSIKNDSFVTIPYNRRVSMLDAMRAANANRGSSQAVIQALDIFVDTVNVSGLVNKTSESFDSKRYTTDFRKMVERFTEMEQSQREAASTMTRIKEALQRSDAFLEQQTEILSSLKHTESVIESILNSINAHKAQAEDIASEMKIAEKEIESRKLSIDTFSSNIQEYKESIDQIIVQANAVIDRGTEVDDLIEQSQNALQLTSAEGISGAFAAQYKLANNWKIYGGWIGGCFVMLTSAIVITIMLVSEKKNTESGEQLSPILIAFPWIIVVGRAVSVSICLSAAAFCARQYTKQKALAEDYAYKSVLSKSIVAFTEELKKRDDKKVTDYLTTVLAEIHRDPSRNKISKNDSLSLVDIKSLIESIMTKTPQKAA